MDDTTFISTSSKCQGGWTPKRTVANRMVGFDLFRLITDRLTSGIAQYDLQRVFDYRVGFGNRVVYRHRPP